MTRGAKLLMFNGKKGKISRFSGRYCRTRGHRADSSEAVTAVTAGQRMAKALKTGIDRSPPRITRVAAAPAS